MDIRPNLIRCMIGTVQSASRFALSDIRFVRILTRIQLLLPSIPLQNTALILGRNRSNLKKKKKWQQEEVKRFIRKSPFFLCEVEEKVQFHWRMCISFLTSDHILSFFFLMKDHILFTEVLFALCLTSRHANFIQFVLYLL